MIDHIEYLALIRDDFREFVVSESQAFRGRGTNSKDSRIRIIKLIFLKGAYSIVERFESESDNNMFPDEDMDVFVGIINDIIGTSYSDIKWRNAQWFDDDDGGVWTDDNNGGIFVDIQTG